MVGPVSRRVLVVDDDAPIRFVVSATLSRAGYNVAEAQDGGQAKLMILAGHQNRNPFDLIILDLQMPLIRGDVLFRELVQLDYCPPVLLMSGSDADGYSELTADRHCAGVLDKPFKSKVLLELVAGAFCLPGSVG